MGFLFSLLDNPYVPWVLAFGAVVIAYRFLAPHLRFRVPGVPSSREDLLARMLGPSYVAKKLDREVQRLKKLDNHLGAGKLLEDAGRLPEAADAYIQGQEYWAAASTFERLGRSERAAELYLQAGDHKKGAALFAAAGKHVRAAALFQEKGNNLEAARLYAQGGQWGTAAELYEKSGYPLRAAEAWEKDGKPLKAAENYEKHFMENVSFSTTYSSTAPAAENKAALQAGRLFEQAGQLERAVNAYSKGGFHKPAAEALLKLGQPAKAAELFLRAEDHEKAASAFEKAGDAVRAATLRGEQAFKADRAAEAAAWFVKGRDYLRAAELYESVGMLAEAAGAYEAGDSWAAAGGVYIRAGLKDRAAAAYEKAGELETAAALYEQLGDAGRSGDLYGRAGFSFKSGEAAARSGEREKAIALLQRVPPGDENYRAATELLARLFIETGRPALAMERLRKVIGGEAASAANLDLYYWLALAHEAAGAPAEALSIFKKMLAEDLSFRDVSQRVTRLSAAVTAGPAQAPAGSAAPAGRAPTAPGPASRVPRFVPKDEIARGPLGIVWRGEDTSDGRSVAMRMIPVALLAPPGLLSALAADLKAAHQLSHPNLVKVIAFMEWKGERCLVTEHVAGRNFAEAITSGRRLGFQQVHALGRLVAQALGAAHGKGLVHGSVQPSNVMVAAGVIKLADLGLARLARSVPASPAYHAPEGGLSAADDLFALCAVMYHLLTGTHPLSQPQGVGLPLPSQLAPGVPDAMDKLLIRGLHPRPELRLASAEDLLRDLREMVKIG
ncbi:MAG TPA: protein kinase [Vicinamibacteria bacterium]|nr:protein kinase [Vicinamibacteria bacterium]